MGYLIFHSTDNEHCLVGGLQEGGHMEDYVPFQKVQVDSHFHINRMKIIILPLGTQEDMLKFTLLFGVLALSSLPPDFPLLLEKNGHI